MWFSQSVAAKIMGFSRTQSNEPLTLFNAREKEVMMRIAQGLDNQIISQELHLAKQTALNYVLYNLSKDGGQFAGSGGVVGPRAWSAVTRLSFFRGGLWSCRGADPFDSARTPLRLTIWPRTPLQARALMVRWTKNQGEPITMETLYELC